MPGAFFLGEEDMMIYIDRLEKLFARIVFHIIVAFVNIRLFDLGSYGETERFANVLHSVMRPNFGIEIIPYIPILVILFAFYKDMRAGNRHKWIPSMRHRQEVHFEIIFLVLLAILILVNSSFSIGILFFVQMSFDLLFLLIYENRRVVKETN